MPVHQVARQLSQNYVFIDTVGEDAGASTNIQVHQKFMITPIEHQMAVLHQVPAAILLCLIFAPYFFSQAVVSHMRTEPQFKIIAFFVSARGTQFHSELFNAMGITVLEIHSRKSQPHRTRVSEQFRSAASAIMFSSDVSARGVDYPDVTLVIQVGVPADKSQYDSHHAHIALHHPPFPHSPSSLQIHPPSRSHSAHWKSRTRPSAPHTT